MKTKFIQTALFLAGILFFLFLAACSPKCIINGRVVDAETEHPIKGAAVAIRWIEDQSETDSETPQAFDSAQDFSDKDGYFNIPEHPDKNFVWGCIKKGIFAGVTAAALPAVKKKQQLPDQISVSPMTCKSV